MKNKTGNVRARADAGFTLIELMIVVGIIGILVSIAIPNFQVYQAKARQSEAKLALAAIYGAEKSFYAEYAAYAGSMDAIGYAPEGSRRFYLVGWAAAHSGSITGFNGTLLTASWPTVNNPYTCPGGPATLGTQLVGDAQTFTVVATGCIRNNRSVQDTWTIDETKVISNTVVGT